MSKFAVGQTVLIPGTVQKITEDKTGVYVDVEVVANNTTKTFSLEESNVVALADASED